MDFEQVLKEVVWRLVTEGSVSYRNQFAAFKASLQWRQPFATPWPRMEGVHSALVMGPRSNTNFMFSWSAVAGRMYQVQYNTNLNFTKWTNSGAAFPAPGATVTVTNSIGTNGQRFYRVMIVP